MLYASANRDESVFGPTADVFDPARDPNPHVAFGFGPHFCIGRRPGPIGGPDPPRGAPVPFRLGRAGRTGGAHRLSGHRRRPFGAAGLRGRLTRERASRVEGGSPGQRRLSGGSCIAQAEDGRHDRSLVVVVPACGVVPSLTHRLPSADRLGSDGRSATGPGRLGDRRAVGRAVPGSE